MMRNTYLNGLQGKNNNEIKTERSFYGSSKKVNWTDNNTGKREALVSTTFHVDLYFQKDIKQVISHKKLRPSKSIIKGRSNSVDVRRSNLMNNQQLNNNNNQNYNNNQGFKQMNNINDLSSDDKKPLGSKVNNYIQGKNNPNLPTRSFSLEPKGDNSKGLINFQPDKNVSGNIQIITPNVNSIINNNYNNIYIQSPTDMDFKKLNNIYSPDDQMNIKSNMLMNNNPNTLINRVASAGRKENPPYPMNNTNLMNYNLKSNSISNNNIKEDSDKIIQNSLDNSYDPKQIKVIDYSNSNYMSQPRTSIFTIK